MGDLNHDPDDSADDIPDRLTAIETHLTEITERLDQIAAKVTTLLDQTQHNLPQERRRPD